MLAYPVLFLREPEFIHLCTVKGETTYFLPTGKQKISDSVFEYAMNLLQQLHDSCVRRQPK